MFLTVVLDDGEWKYCSLRADIYSHFWLTFLFFFLSPSGKKNVLHLQGLLVKVNTRVRCTIDGLQLVFKMQSVHAHTTNCVVVHNNVDV